MESPEVKEPNELVERLSKKVIGQPAALKFIVPYIEMYQAGLSPSGRPAGAFLLLGPTGTGKTRTIEVLAEVLHGSERNFVRIDCGEFQMEHEVAKLIGAPPGYLGHRETQPIITQKRLTEVTSENSDLALVLFDEIEKAAPSLTKLLLGILDKATLRLGDNSSVNFERSLIFLTSNLGAREMTREMNPSFGFGGTQREKAEMSSKLEGIAMAAVRKRFSPEFINRIDAIVTYQPLDAEALSSILEQQIDELQQHVNTRLGARCFAIEVAPESRTFLLSRGTSSEYGARELKRTIHRHLTQPLATLVAAGKIEPGARVRVDVAPTDDKLLIRTIGRGQVALPDHPVVLIVDDNADLLEFLKQLMDEAEWSLVTAQSMAQAREYLDKHRVSVALLDYLLPDGSGMDLAVEMHEKNALTQVIMMTGAQLTGEDEAVTQRHGFPVLRKPFLASEVMSLIRAGLAVTKKAGT